ncbi:MAG: NAD(P)H-hydrate dehydratase, partial [Gallionella sp.]
MSKPIPALSKKKVIANFPKRPRDSHKGLFGTVVVIGGASGMVGAPLLAARAALKLGAGCVHVGLLAENTPCVDMQQPELMLHSATDLLRPRPRPLPNPDGTTSHSTRLSKNNS